MDELTQDVEATLRDMNIGDEVSLNDGNLLDDISVVRIGQDQWTVNENVTGSFDYIVGYIVGLME